MSLDTEKWTSESTINQQAPKVEEWKKGVLSKLWYILQIWNWNIIEKYKTNFLKKLDKTDTIELKIQNINKQIKKIVNNDELYEALQVIASDVRMEHLWNMKIDNVKLSKLIFLYETRKEIKTANIESEEEDLPLVA